MKIIKFSFANFLIVLSYAFIGCSVDSSENSLSSNSNGINGSYSKILVVGNYLYGVNDSELTTVNIADKENPSVIDKQELGFGIESIFHHKGVLFIGSNLRMYIFAINEQGIPVRKSTADYINWTEEVLPCDPIVANDKYAYVTLSVNTNVLVEQSCGGNGLRPIEFRELRIYDITDLNNPILVNTIPMHNPKGLGLDGNYLFVCNDDAGIIVYDVTDPLDLKTVFIKDDFYAYDLIPHDDLLIVVGRDQLSQFDYSDINDIKFLSNIEL